MGHEVVVVTQTAPDANESFPFQVARRPSFQQLFQFVKWCDIFWQNNLSLRTIWPALLLRKPVVVTHQGSYCRRPAGLDMALRLKHGLANRASSVSVSQAVASCFKTPSVIIPNPYDSALFRITQPPYQRTSDLIFLGRVVSEKGLDVLIEALARLRSRGFQPQLTVVGSGPELQAMQNLAARLEVNQQIRFVGSKRGAELAQILNRHRILVVPSRYDEPFGVVALEGIACGCFVVGSAGGGLPEAIGPCGLTFPNGDAEALMTTLENVLAQPNEPGRFVARAAEHLAQFQPAVIAGRYLDLFGTKI